MAAICRHCYALDICKPLLAAARTSKAQVVAVVKLTSGSATADAPLGGPAGLAGAQAIRIDAGSAIDPSDATCWWVIFPSIR